MRGVNRKKPVSGDRFNHQSPLIHWKGRGTALSARGALADELSMDRLRGKWW
jgi:hypothetical protein